MISELSPSTETIVLWNDLTKNASAIQSRLGLLGLAKLEQGLSLSCVEVATEYIETFELQHLQSSIERYLVEFRVSFTFLRKVDWPQGPLRQPEPNRLQAERKWWADNRERILKEESEAKSQ